MLRYLIILILVGSVTSFYKYSGIARKFYRLNSCSIDSDEDNNDKPNEKVDYESESLDRLFSRVEDIGTDKIPEELRNSINKKLVDYGPSEIEKKMNIMGITPFTLTGFLVGFIIIILNNTLGNGWATNLFYANKLEDQITSTPESIYSQLPVSKEVIDRIIKNHDEYLKEKVNYHYSGAIKMPKY